MTGSNNVEELVGKLKDVPPLAEMQAMLRAVGDDDVDFRELAKVIESSPQIAAHLIKVSNSAYYGTASSVNSVEDAIIRVLGLDVVRSLVIGLAASSTFHTEKCPGFDPQKYWGSALLTANLGRKIARLIDIGDAFDAENVYMCGLLHNIGLIALAHVAPSPMAEIFTAADRERERSLHEIEGQVLGIDHRQAGAILIAQWGMPEPLQIVIKHYHIPNYEGPNWATCRLVRLCSDWARQCLAGVAEPSMGAVDDRLNIDTADLKTVVQAARDDANSILDLAGMFH